MITTSYNIIAYPDTDGSLRIFVALNRTLNNLTKPGSMYPGTCTARSESFPVLNLVFFFFKNFKKYTKYIDKQRVVRLIFAQLWYFGAWVVHRRCDRSTYTNLVLNSFWSESSRVLRCRCVQFTVMRTVYPRASACILVQAYVFIEACSFLRLFPS